MPRDESGQPYIQPRMPHPKDNGPLGFHFFKQTVRDADFRNLTLPRTFFGRSLLERVDFTGIDLRQSWMCWNDFIDCDFSEADLSGCQMRASVFTRCKFVAADLRRADLRQSSFEGCDLTLARMNGTKADYVYADDFGLSERLSDKQEKVMKWSDDPGPQPAGG